MLKVKDEIELEELKKFGFIEEKGKYVVISERRLTNEEEFLGNIKKHLVYIVYKNTRKLQITNNFISYDDTINNDKFDVLFDLIQAGMIEKVEEI